RPREGKPDSESIPCFLASDQDLGRVEPGRVSAGAGKAAYDFLCMAIDQTLAGAADGIVTAPLHKEGLRAAGLPYPGHTEILAERTVSKRFAMMLYCQRSEEPSSKSQEPKSTQNLDLGSWKFSREGL